MVDNYDSFTFNLYDLFNQFRKPCVVERGNNVDVELILGQGYEGIVFSPGPGTPSEHPVMHKILNAANGRIPVLGICLGYQAIGEFYGCSLRQMPGPIHGQTSTISHTGHISYKGIPEKMDVMHYHSLCLDDVNNDVLEVTSYSVENIPMSLIHKELPVWGFQYHPESILASNGYKLIANWLEYVEHWNHQNN